jgi:hypothetical protein
MQHRYPGLVRDARFTRAREERFHKLRIGTHVTLSHATRDPRSKDPKLDREAAKFEITSLLPAEGQHFQYRVKDILTGRERVVLEDQLVVAEGA